jgi:hypothetical protein
VGLITELIIRCRSAYGPNYCRPPNTGPIKGHYFVVCRKNYACRLRLKCDGTLAEIRFRLSAKRTSPFKSAGASFQSTAVSRGVCISVSNAGYIMFRGSVKSTGYLLHTPVSPSLPLPCVTVCHHISTGVYLYWKHIMNSDLHVKPKKAFRILIQKEN